MRKPADEWRSGHEDYEERHTDSWKWEHNSDFWAVVVLIFGIMMLVLAIG